LGGGVWRRRVGLRVKVADYIITGPSCGACSDGGLWRARSVHDRPLLTLPLPPPSRQVRAFDNDEVVHVDDSVDPIRDLETIQVCE
jgi:hypothetical protein